MMAGRPGSGKSGVVRLWRGALSGPMTPSRNHGILTVQAIDGLPRPAAYGLQIAEQSEPKVLLGR